MPILKTEVEAGVRCRKRALQILTDVRERPSMTLADIYSVIAYYLRHQSEVREYFAQRQQQAAHIREENERRFDPTGIRDRLLARRP